MTRARFTQVSLDSMPYCYCICRCVRRAFLYGKDHYSGQDYEHRRQWVVDRLAVLAEVFAIDLCAYAVMANHCHLVLRINQKSASLDRSRSRGALDAAVQWSSYREVLDQRTTVERGSLKQFGIIAQWNARTRIMASLGFNS